MKALKEKIMYYQIKFIEKVIKEIWKENPTDYGIEYLTYNLINFWDDYVDFETFLIVEEFNISKEVFYEYMDWVSLWHLTKRFLKYNWEVNKEWYEMNLRSFYNYIWKTENPEDFEKERLRDIKESEKKVEIAKDLFFKCMKNVK